MKIKYIGAAIASVAALFVPLACHAQPTSSNTITWAAMDGKPNIDLGKAMGIYIWHEGPHVFVETVDHAADSSKFTGRLRIEGGIILDDSGMGLENNDRIYRQGHSTISLAFHTSVASDQVEFHISGGLTLDCDFAVNGSRDVPVFYGANATQAPGNPFYVIVNTKRSTAVTGSGSPSSSGSSTGFNEPFSAALGTPGVRVGKVDGFYIYHSGSTVTVTTTTTSARSRIFSGTITAGGGKITGTHPIGLEANDSFSQPSANTLTFRFNTENGADSIQFQLVGASTVNFALSSPGTPAARVYVGGNAISMTRNNITFDVGR